MFLYTNYYIYEIYYIYNTHIIYEITNFNDVNKQVLCT